jgi:hypothetical protein
MSEATYTPLYDRNVAMVVYENIAREHDRLLAQPVLPWGQFSSDNEVNRKIYQRHNNLCADLKRVRDELRKIVIEEARL